MRLFRVLDLEKFQLMRNNQHDDHPKLVHLAVALGRLCRAHRRLCQSRIGRSEFRFRHAHPHVPLSNRELHKSEASRYISRMSTVKEIEAAIPKLPPTELAELRAWFDDYFKKVSGELEKVRQSRLQAACESANRDAALNREIEAWQSFDDAMPSEVS